MLLNGVRYFFVNDPPYFDRDGFYGGPTGDYWDNGERFSEFSRAAIEIAKHIWPADVFIVTIGKPHSSPFSPYFVFRTIL